MPEETSQPPKGERTSCEIRPRWVWMAVYACPHCPFVHTLLLEQAPVLHAAYAFACPLSGKEAVAKAWMFSMRRLLPPDPQAKANPAATPIVANLFGR